MYVDDKTTQYLIAILKSYGIKHIVSSPGMQNAGFNLSVQNDEDFKCYSVIDERSAGYVATGISFETNEPVILTCTGATASRNYLSSLTEAYYRKLPIIALTYTHYSDKFNLEPQTIDRSISQNDVKIMSLELPVIDNDADKAKCISYINAAITTAFRTSMPVHINVVNPPKPMTFNTKTLPSDFWTTKLYNHVFDGIKKELYDKKIGIFIGEHKKFSKNEQNAISDFAISYNATVFCDHTSNYHGANKVLISQITEQCNIDYHPHIMIDMGGISGEYSSAKLFKKIEFWRISQDGMFHERYGNATKKLFICREIEFFTTLKADKKVSTKFFDTIKKAVDTISVPDLPLCNALICKNLAKYIPQNASLHISILNSLRNMNFFKLDESIDVVCNVGGFGIDGPVSSAVGQSLATDKKVFGLIGDLAFFYDMNALGIREIKQNLRLLIVNNNRGQEFRLNPLLENVYAEQSDKLVAAGGHNKGGAKGWAESCGFYYMSTSLSSEIEDKVKDFCTMQFDKPVLFEVFTTNEDEQKGLSLMRFAKVLKQPKKKVNIFKRIKRSLKNG